MESMQDDDMGVEGGQHPDDANPTMPEPSDDIRANRRDKFMTH